MTSPQLVEVSLKGSGEEHASLSPLGDLADRLPDFSAAEREKILGYVKANFSIHGTLEAYLKGWPTADLREIGEKIRSDASRERREVTCPEHHLTHPEGAECRSCAADRKAGAT
jgi:hypothetical protein